MIVRRKRSHRQALALALTGSVFGGSLLAAQAPAECPLHAQHQREAAVAPAAHAAHGTSAAFDQVDARGDLVMRFAHSAATHRFLLNAAGGTIEVRVVDHEDQATLDQVRAHLKKVAADFQVGDFAMPLEIHGRQPSGVEAMRAKGAAIRYRYRETEHGARVELASEDAAAVAAIHAFLRFQIVEHRTGDSLEPAGS